MSILGGKQIVDATSVVLEALRPLADCEWNTPAGDLEWTCHQTGAHIASNLLKYATQLASRADDAYLRFGVSVTGDVPPAELLRIIHGSGLLLAGVVDRSPPDARAWHWGPTDASGFAAMGIGELLVHTHDIARGLSRDWRPPNNLAQLVLARLRTQTPAVDDPSTMLLWSTGRVDIDGLDREDEWVWRAASR